MVDVVTPTFITAVLLVKRLIGKNTGKLAFMSERSDGESASSVRGGSSTKIRRSPFANAVPASTVARRAKRRTGPRDIRSCVPRGRARAPSHLTRMRSLPFLKATSTTWTTSRRGQF